jgi:hypothetical protein
MVQVHLDVSTISTGTLGALSKKHPLAIVMSQDCDLVQDHLARDGKAKEDKTIPNVLFCEVVTAVALKGNVDDRQWKSIKINDNKRFQFLQRIEPINDALSTGLSEMGIDFKRYFTMPTDEVYLRIKLGEAKRRSVLVSPYLEHLSSRFAFFLSRVALEEDHVSE